MREQLLTPPLRPEPIPPPRPVAVRRPPRDRCELALLGLFALASLWVVGLDLWQVVVHGRVWTGTDGVYIVDQMQYLAWIRDASHHVLAANLFVLRGTPADYLQPAVAVSALLTALGVAPYLALLLWKPVAVVAMFLATRAYVHRSLASQRARRAALALALFFSSVTVVYGSLTVLGDLYPVFLSWGYTFGLLSLAAMIGALVLLERDRARRQRPWAAAALAALASLLHPWHGELLAVTVVLAELISYARLRRLRLSEPGLVLAGALLPLLYYAVLGRADLSWHLARDASKHTFPLWPVLLALLPLAIPALPALRRAPRTYMQTIGRAWLLAALLVWILSATALGATPLHAFEGITVPLAVMAAEGVGSLRLRRLPRPGLALAAAVALATIPGSIRQFDEARELAAPTTDNANFIQPGEKAALDYIARQPGDGGVLTRSYLGAVVPSHTGRRTLIGDCLWSQPRCTDRGDLAQNLFGGLMDAHTARHFVAHTGARFALADCQTTENVERLLGPLVVGVRHFGCAAVYELRDPKDPVGPLASRPTRRARLVR